MEINYERTVVLKEVFTAKVDSPPNRDIMPMLKADTYEKAVELGAEAAQQLVAQQHPEHRYPVRFQVEKWFEVEG